MITTILAITVLVLAYFLSLKKEYNERDITDFGNYVLKNKNAKPNEDKVTHSQFENWKQQK